MSFSISEDIRPMTDLKKHTREVLEQVRRTGRPVILTVNGRADAVLLDVKTYEKHLKASNLARFLGRAEADIAAGRTRSSRLMLKKLEKSIKERTESFMIGTPIFDVIIRKRYPRRLARPNRCLRF